MKLDNDTCRCQPVANGCDAKERCLRYVCDSVDGERVSFCDFSLINPQGGECDMFIEVIE